MRNKDIDVNCPCKVNIKACKDLIETLTPRSPLEFAIRHLTLGDSIEEL